MNIIKMKSIYKTINNYLKENLRKERKKRNFLKL